MPEFRAGPAWAMGGPPPTRVLATQGSVSTCVTVFCTALACVHHGLLPADSWIAVQCHAVRRWRCSARRFLAALRERQLLDAGPDGLLAAWRGPVIGWVPGPPQATDPWQTRVCTDFRWILAVLSRVQGRLLLPRREPASTWRALFGDPFALDDARFDAVAGVAHDRIPTALPQSR